MTKLKQLLQASAQTTSTSTGLLIIRLIVGIAFMLHGWPKMQHSFNWMGPDAPVPGILQFLAAFSEFGGGLAWIIGLLTPVASLGIAFTMIVATYMHAIVNGDPFVSQGGPSYELALVFLGISILLITTGPGKFSLDAKVFGEKVK